MARVSGKSASKSNPATGRARAALDPRLGLALVLHGKPVPPGWIETLQLDDGAIDRAMAAGTVTLEGAGFVLTPAINGETLIQSASWSARRQLHLQLAAACRMPPARLEDAARHLEAAGDLPKAAELWLAAADLHCRRHRHRAAANCFAAGLRLLPAKTTDEATCRIVDGINQCATLSGQFETAIDLLSDWGNTPPWNARPVVRARTQLALANLFARTQRHADSGRARMCAAEDLMAIGRAGEAATAATAAAWTLGNALQLRAALVAADVAERAAIQAADTATRVQALTVRGWTLGVLGQTENGQREIRRALDLALEHRLTSLAADAYRLLGSASEYASCYRDEQTAFSRALAFCRRHGESEIARLCLGCLSYSCFRSGDWKRSEETAGRVLADRGSPAGSRAVAEGVLGLLHAHRGANRPAREKLDRCATACREMGLLTIEFFYLLGRAVIDETAGRHDEMSTHLLALLEFWRQTEDQHDAIPGLTLGVIHFGSLGRREDAALFAEALDQIASASANPEASGAVHLATAELALLDGDASGAARLFQRAIDAYEQRDLSIERIRARLRLGHALRLAASPAQSEGVLAEAGRLAQRLGARPLAAQVERECAAIADTPGPATALWETLSPRQRDVARFLARGSTNKEIAAELGLSVRTVDMHVAHVLSRLGCRTRTEAATRIAAELQ